MEPMAEVGKDSKYVCYDLPPKINSPGISTYLKEGKGFNLLKYSIPTIEIQILLIFCITQALQLVLQKLRLPPLVSQILAGLIFNPIILRRYIPDLIDEGSIRVLGLFTVLAFQFFMFQSGVKMKVGMLRTVGGKVIFTGVVSVLLPFLFGCTVLQYGDNDMGQLHVGDLSALVYSMTSFPVIVQLLNDLRLINTALGRLCLSTALVSDLLSVAIYIVLTMARVTRATEVVLTGSRVMYNNVGLAFLLFMLFVFGLVRPALGFLKNKLKDGKHAEDVFAYFVIAIFLMSCFLSNFFREIVFYAAFFVGLVVPSGPPLGSAVVEKFDAASLYLLPLFVTTCAMRTNLRAISYSSSPNMLIQPLLVILIEAIKFLVCFLCHSHFWKLPINDSCAFALVMCSKGVVELALYTFHNDGNIFSDDGFLVMIIMVLALNSVLPLAIRRMYSPARRYSGMRRRNLLEADPMTELQIVSCIHTPKDVTATIRLLHGATAGDGPLSVMVLHLIKLVAQSTPQLIFHTKERIVLCEYPYSENVIRLFNEFEQESNAGVAVEVATAVAPTTLMYDDICTIALDKQASLIILPFHQRQSELDGAIESEDYTIRDLNNRILDKAPCSIAILVDRYHHTRTLTFQDNSLVTYKIAVIFLGGKDDREALAFALRMAQDERVSLSVAHLVASDDEEDVDRLPEDMVQDNLILRMVDDREYITYRKQVASDATVTASIIRSMANEYELIIVGTRNKVDNTPQTSGLEEWCEFPELGVLGDLLLSKDSEGTCSILVVQQ